MSEIFKMGDSSPWIAKIQRAINEIIYSNLDTDGVFGQDTKLALQDIQVYFKIDPTGVYDGKIAEMIDAYINDRFLVETDYKNAAVKLSVEEPTVRAVTEVEAKGYGFLKTGRSTILFERHIFYREFNKRLSAKLIDVQTIAKKEGLDLSKLTNDGLKIYLINKYPGIYNPTPGGYLGVSKGIEHEYVKMEQAKQFDDQAALMSVSYGLFQIMGFNFKAAGFQNVSQMYLECARSERKQLDSFCNFVLSEKRLIEPLRRGDMTAFAYAYNGPAQQGYDVKLTQARNKWKNILKA